MAENKKVNPAAELVDVFIPKIPGDESPVFVGVNGRSWLIPRGKRYQVPRSVADVLAQAERNARAAEEYAARKKREMGIVRGIPQS